MSVKQHYRMIWLDCYTCVPNACVLKAYLHAVIGES